MPEGLDPMQFPEVVSLRDVKVDDAVAETLQAWVYPDGEDGPPWLVVAALERNHLDGTVTVVLRRAEER